MATTADVGNLLATGNMTNTVDGVTLAANDRVLVKDQDNAEQNGIYRVLTVGTGSNGTWERSKDANANDRITAGMTTVVSEGDLNISKTFRLSTPDPIVVGVTELVFTDPFAGGSAAGANTHVQFNDDGITAGSANLTFNKSTNTLTVGNSLVTTNLIGNANITVTGSLLPSANITYDLGSPSQRWRDGWFSGSTIHIGTESMSVGEDGTWAFTSGGTTVEFGTEAVFNPPSANISGNVTATNYLFANGTPLMTVVNSMIGTANTNMQGHVAEAISTANVNLKGYVDNGLSSLSSNKISANASNVTVTANFINVAVNSSNIASFSSTGIITTGNIDAASVNATNLYGAIQTAAQPNITSLGTLSGLTMGGALAMGTNKITGLGTPIASTDATTKQYVDEVAAGLKAAPAVEAATTTNLTATYNNGTLGVGATLTATTNGAFPNIDGVAITSTTTGENGVLVKNQSTSAQNGRYNLTQVGDGSNPWILTRCGVCDEADEIPGSYVFVKAGSTLASTGWVAYVAEPSTFVVGTNNITYFQFSGAGTYTAGTGLTLAGTQFSVDAAQTQITQVGTLGNLTVSGNVTASFIIGNGSQLTGLPAGYTNTDVANYLPNHSGNIGASSVNATNLTGTLLTAAQTSITSVGTLTGLTVNGATVLGTTSGIRLRTVESGGVIYIQAGNGVSGSGNTITFAPWTNTVSTMSIDIANRRVGIRKAVPTVELDVDGAGAFSGSLTVTGNVDIAGNLNFTAGSTADILYLGNKGITGVNALQFNDPGISEGVSWAGGNLWKIVESPDALTNASGNLQIVQDSTRRLSVRTDGTVDIPGVLRINSGNAVTAITNGGTNGVGNIGASGAGFNTVFAKASSAQYADLAEVYVSDKNYVPGTVVVFGGTQEVTVSTISHDPTVAGVVSTNPAYLMNDTVEGSAVALQGRVPCRVLGPVVKGDRVVSSNVRGVAERLDMSKYQPGCIIGKTLGSVPDSEIATIEVVVGRN